MRTDDVISLTGAAAALGSMEELESRLEAATCVSIDACFAQYCWQFAAGYGCPSECVVQCAPFNGCWPYCHE
ncbi:MAG: hypothetical protein AB1640_04175 [bacterium]